MMKGKRRVVLIILTLIGLIGASNTGLIDSVEYAELHQEDAVMYNGVPTSQWDVVIEIDEVCWYYCFVDIYSIQILVDGEVVVGQQGSGSQPVISLNEPQTTRIQEWRYSIESEFSTVELNLVMGFLGYYSYTSYSNFWNLHIGLVNGALGISRVVEMDVQGPLTWAFNEQNNLHSILWSGGDQEIDTDQDGFTDAGASYTGPCSVGVSVQSSEFCHVDQLGDDKFPEDPTQQTDRDGDGYGDNPNGTMADAFPDSPSQWNDTDEDGYGDNGDGVNADSCPNEWGNSSEDRFGCKDFDGDGWSNPWSVNMMEFGDACPDEWGTSFVDRFGCPDIDGDSVSDLGDAFPMNPSQWNDIDGDGYGDNPFGSNRDMFPYDEMEWNDTDGDGYGDNVDWDVYDRYEWEDSDGDGVGDNADVYPDDFRRSAEGDMLEPGKQFFSVLVVILSVIIILYPKDIEESDEVSVL